jgi:hypothetical protein
MELAEKVPPCRRRGEGWGCMTVWSRSNLVFGAVALSLMAAAAAVNAIVDPFNLTLWVTREGLNAYLPALQFQSRLAKAVGIIRNRPDTIILGSSVADGGFRIPGSTIYEAQRLLHAQADPQQAPSPLVYNAGIRGGGTYEAVSYLKHSYLNNPRLRRVIVDLEWGVFTDLKEGNNPKLGAPMPGTPFLGHSFAWPFGYFKYLTWTALDDAVRTVEHNRGIANPGGIRDLLSAIASFIPLAAAEPTPEPVGLLSELSVIARTPAEARSIYFSIMFAANYHVVIARRGPSAVIRSDTIANLKAIVDFTRENGIELIVIIPPQHPAYWAEMLNEDLWQYHLEWVRAVGRLTPYYDFSGLIDFSADADDYFLGDPLHFERRVGEILLPLLLGGDLKDRPGVDYVTPATLEAGIARRSQRLLDWLDRNPYLTTVLPKLQLHPRGFRALGDTLPTVFAPAPKGFRIVRLLDRFYGLPANQEPFDLRKVLVGEYEPTVVGNSASAVVAEIERRGLNAWDYAPAPLADGEPIASGSGTGEQAFDGNAATFWTSDERGEGIKGHSWIGYAFAEPQAVRRIRLSQSVNPAIRQDRVMVQTSHDGGLTWTDVLPAPARLTDLSPPLTSVINIPDTAPAAHWRVVAAGENATLPGHAWLVLEVEFLVPEPTFHSPDFVAGDLAGGRPISSGEDTGSPEKAFDGQSDTFWISPERGTDVKSRAWIGYAFALPQAVRRIRVMQTTTPPYRQDFVLVEKSIDGHNWQAAASHSFRLKSAVGWINLPAGEAARYWRLVAAGDNAKLPEHAWTPLEIALFVSPDRSAGVP